MDKMNWIIEMLNYSINNISYLYIIVNMIISGALKNSKKEIQVPTKVVYVLIVFLYMYPYTQITIIFIL